MLYDPKDPLQRENARLRFEKLMSGQNPFELTGKRQRSLSQNSYLHVIIAYFGALTGNDAGYVKRMYFKLHCNPDLFVREKDDPLMGKVRVLRSSRDLTGEEMTLAIDRFIGWAAQEAGIYIPSSEDHALVQQMELEVERCKRYL